MTSRIKDPSAMQTSHDHYNLARAKHAEARKLMNEIERMQAAADLLTAEGDALERSGAVFWAKALLRREGETA